MTDDQGIRHWCLTLRDLCDNGADSASVTFGPVTLIYRPQKGATLVGLDKPVDLSEEWIDSVGLVPA